MTKKTQKPTMRTATLKKRKQYRFGKFLAEGEKVFIREEFAGKGRYVYTAFRKENDTLGFGVTRSEFEYTDKQTFIVHVSRISYASRNIEVEATDRKEAEQLATEQAGDFEFSEHDADYKADSILTKEEHFNIFPNSDIHK